VLSAGFYCAPAQNFADGLNDIIDSLMERTRSKDFLQLWGTFFENSAGMHRLHLRLYMNNSTVLCA